MRKGFTLLELLVVVIIIAILAAIAVPQFFRTAERARAAEGVNVLGALRSAQLRYCSDYGKTADDRDKLDVSVPTMKYFQNIAVIGDIDCTDSTQNDTVIATITRNANSVPAEFSGYQLGIQIDGGITCENPTCPPGITRD